VKSGDLAGAELADRIVDARGQTIAAVDLRKFEQDNADSHRVISSAGIVSRVQERRRMGVHGATLPWATTYDVIRFGPGQVTIWAGDQSCGKSTLLSYCTLSWIEQGQLCLVTTLEEPLSEYGLRICRQGTGEMWPDDVEIERLLEDAGDRLYLWDVEGRLSPKRVVAMVRYAAEQLGVQHFVLDNWTKVVPPSNDSANMQWDIFASLLQIARDTGMHVHVVMHLNKEGRSEEIPSARHIRSTSTLTDQADQICLVWRNEKKERVGAGEESVSVEAKAELYKQPDVVLVTAKTKFQGRRARLGLWFHNPSKQYSHGYGSFPMRSSLLAATASLPFPAPAQLPESDRAASSSKNVSAPSASNATSPEAHNPDADQASA
jgi:twinkle protein